MEYYLVIKENKGLLHATTRKVKEAGHKRPPIDSIYLKCSERAHLQRQKAD